jgi:hypothetical protein
MENIPVFIAIAVGVAGFGTMCVAFFQIWRQGGWQKAMAPTSEGKWFPARRLMLIGALLGCAFALFLSVLIAVEPPPTRAPWLR